MCPWFVGKGETITGGAAWFNNGTIRCQGDGAKTGKCRGVAPSRRRASSDRFRSAVRDVDAERGEFHQDRIPFGPQLVNSQFFHFVQKSGADRDPAGV